MGETQLNGAYYGPAIPPKQRSYHSHGRTRSLCCFPCCLIGLICKLVAAVIFLAGVAALVLWLVYRPTNIKFHVVNASLTEFTLTNNNQIRYNLALDISVRNPNRRIGVHYDRIEAQAFYEGERFDTNMLSGFYQGRKNTTMLNTVFQGNSSIMLSGSDVAKFGRETNDGTFSIDVRIYLRIRFKVGRVRTHKFKPTIKCDLRVPFTSSGAPPAAFNTKRCKVDY